MGRVVIRRYLDFVGAQLDRTRLEGAGIGATAVDAAGYLPLTGIGGGVALEVDEGDVARAEEVLGDAGLAEDELEEHPEDVRCPRCELEYTRFQKPPISPAVVFSPLVVVAATAYLLSSKKRWYCLKCEHVWDDERAGPRRKTPLPEGIPKPVFRLRRGHPGLGLMLGGMLGIVCVAVLAQIEQTVARIGVLLLPLMGYAGLRTGRKVSSDVCSEPTCRAPLPPGQQTCRSCKGAVVGIIRRANEHYIEAAVFRREMAAAATEQGDGPAKKAPVKAKRKKTKPPAEPTSRVWEPPGDT